MPPFHPPPNFKFKYFYFSNNLNNSTPSLVTIHDVNLDSENATASTLHNLLGPLCALSIQSVVSIIYFSDLKGIDKEASSLGSLVDSVGDCPNLEFVIPL
jgi:hypothetical protein